VSLDKSQYESHIASLRDALDQLSTAPRTRDTLDTVSARRDEASKLHDDGVDAGPDTEAAENAVKAAGDIFIAFGKLARSIRAELPCKFAHERAALDEPMPTSQREALDCGFAQQTASAHDPKRRAQASAFRHANWLALQGLRPRSQGEAWASSVRRMDGFERTLRGRSRSCVARPDNRRERRSRPRCRHGASRRASARSGDPGGGDGEGPHQAVAAHQGALVRALAEALDEAIEELAERDAERGGR
jgi:hypothetical protein